jgi:uncharacterized protein YkwD
VEPRGWRARGTVALALVVPFLLVAGLSGCAPSPDPSTLPDASTVGPTDPLVSSILAAVNQDRAARGLPPYSWSPKLAALAASWSGDMAGTGALAHQDLLALIATPTYADFTASGENVYSGAGSSTAADVESSWMSSSFHRGNVLSTSFDVVGIGYVTGSDGRLWVTADFATP